MSVPPPMPSAPPSAPPKKGLSGCAIAAIIAAVVGVVGIFLIAMLAAIALPQYQDYIARTRIVQAAAAAEGVKLAVVDYRERTDICPDASALSVAAPTFLPLDQENKARAAVVWVRPEDGRCAFDLRFENLSAAADGQTLRYVLNDDGSWDCRSGTLTGSQRPMPCR